MRVEDIAKVLNISTGDVEYALKTAFYKIRRYIKNNPEKEEELKILLEWLMSQEE